MSTSNNEHVNNAEAIMKDHQFTCLASSERIEAWRCSKPGCSAYAFDILITWYGIAVIGDIDNMTFRVGSSYGLEFLAADRVDNYMIGKLSDESREYEIDTKELLDFCRMHWLDLIAERIQAGASTEEVASLANQLQAAGLPAAWLTPGDDKATAELTSLSQLSLVVRAVRDWNNDYMFVPNGAGFEEICLFELAATIDELDSVPSSDLTSLFHIIAHAPYGACELSEWSFRRPAHNLISRLHMVNLAAKRILEIKSDQKLVETEAE